MMRCCWKKQQGDYSDLIDSFDAANHGELHVRWSCQKFEHGERISMQCIDRYVKQPWQMEDSQSATDRWARHKYRGTPIMRGPGHLQPNKVVREP